MSRYEQLLQIVEQVKPRTIIEVGTYNGDRAIQMATEALKHGPVNYYGFDLFEEATAETDAQESNVKAHYLYEDVRQKLDEWRNGNVNFSFGLTPGNTRETLAKIVEAPFPEGPVLAFIDGGHSLETIQSDYEFINLVADHIVLDDYYKPIDGSPDIEKFGCNKILESIGEMGKDWFVLPVGDKVQGGGKVFMATVGFNPPIAIEKRLVVQTKNSVDDSTITDNIAYALSQNFNELKQCRRHNGKAVIVSGGPSFKNHLKEIRKAKREGAYIFCVKTSHDTLIKHRIIPFGCLLLDPRPHVLDFVENPHPKVKYFTASQVHPVTVDRLVERKANVILYHALVGAGEEKLLNGKSMVSGGSTSATRGISLLNAIGFCSFDLYGFDTCFLEPPEDYPHKEGGKALMQVKVNGRDFLTTAELIAQAQDFQKIAELCLNSNSIDLSVHGDGIIPYIWSKLRVDKADFEATYGSG